MNKLASNIYARNELSDSGEFVRDLCFDFSEILLLPIPSWEQVVLFVL